MTSWKLRSVAALMLIAAVTSAPAFGQTKLALKFQPGAAAKYDMLQATTISVTPPGETKAFSTQIDQSWVLESTVKKVLDDGAAELAEHFQRIAMTLQLPLPIGKRIAVDTDQTKPSEEKVENEMRESFAKVIGLDWQITRKPDGAITKVGLSEPLSDLLVDNPQVGNLADTFSETGLRKLWDQATITFPNQPVAKGDSWEQSVTISLPIGKLVTQRKCTYAGKVEDGLDKVDVKLSTKFTAAKDSKPKWELTSDSGDGEVYLDGRAGRIVRSKFTLNVVLKEGPEDRRGTQEIRMITTLFPAAQKPPSK